METTATKYGWDCTVNDDKVIRSASKVVLEKLSQLVERLHLTSDDSIKQQHGALVASVAAIENGRPITPLAEAMAEFRRQVLVRPVHLSDGHLDKLKRVAYQYIQMFALASSDPEIAVAYAKLAKSLDHPELTAMSLETAIYDFMHVLPVFNASNADAIAEMIMAMRQQADVFGFANDADIVSFFQRVDLALAGAVTPEDFIAITQMMNDFEMVVTTRIVEDAPVPALNAYVAQVLMGVNEAREAGMTFTAEADELITESIKQVATAELTREECHNVLHNVRELALVD